MVNEFLKWGMGVVASAGFVGGVGFLMRDTLSKLLTKSVEHNFEKKLEKFKSDIRESERELEQMRNYLASTRSSRNSVLQTKKFEAAENLMRIRQFLGGFTVVAQYMQILKIDELMKSGGDPKIDGFIDAITKPLNLQQKMQDYARFDKDITKLYLSERTVRVFEIYETIMLHSVATLQILAFPMPKKQNLLKEGDLSKKIIEFVPSSQSGFEEFGEKYVYYWYDYFYAEILKELKNELIGEGNMTNDTDSAARLALDFKEAQFQVRTSLKKYGLSENLINDDVSAG